MNKPLNKALATAVSVAIMSLTATFATTAFAASDCLTSALLSNTSPRIDYNPFNVSPQTSSAFTLTVSRIATPSGAPRVTSVDIQFVDTNSSEGNAGIGNTGLNGVEILGGGAQLLRGGVSNFLTGNSLSIGFSGAASNATSSSIRLRIPGSNDAQAGSFSEPIDLAYRCNLSDGTSSTWTRTGAATMVADVAFLVRAVAVGGGTSARLFLNSATLEATGALAVRSTGPFSVSATSQNDFKLRANGVGRNARPDQEIDYDFAVDGKLLSVPGSKRTCPRSGIGGLSLRIQSRIPGSTEALRSGQYSDIVTVTVTPETFSAPACL
jgi:hypothetical protein